MEATEMLMTEHRIVEGVLTSLERAADRLDKKQPVRPGLFSDVADFSKGFTDACHHRKEEGHLFKSLARHGMSETSGPVAVMLDEHEQGRRLTKAIRQAAQQLADGDATAAQRISQNAHAYVTLLRQHIQKEDNFLFPLSDQVIPVDEQESLAEAFEKVEEEEVGAGVHEKYHELAEALEKEVA